jgi:hypothetical protein
MNKKQKIIAIVLIIISCVCTTGLLLVFIVPNSYDIAIFFNLVFNSIFGKGKQNLSFTTPSKYVIFEEAIDETWHVSYFEIELLSYTEDNKMDGVSFKKCNGDEEYLIVFKTETTAEEISKSANFEKYKTNQGNELQNKYSYLFNLNFTFLVDLDIEDVSFSIKIEPRNNQLLYFELKSNGNSYANTFANLWKE